MYTALKAINGSDSRSHLATNFLVVDLATQEINSIRCTVFTFAKKSFVRHTVEVLVVSVWKHHIFGSKTKVNNNNNGTNEVK